MLSIIITLDPDKSFKFPSEGRRWDFLFTLCAFCCERQLQVLLKSSRSHPESSIENLVGQTRETGIARNRCVIKCIAEAMIFSGKQCIADRGSWNDSGADPESNKGKLLDYSVSSGNTL